jgi:hypothetical protein
MLCEHGKELSACMTCGMRKWQAEKQARINDLIRERNELKDKLRRVEIALERESYWGD